MRPVRTCNGCDCSISSVKIGRLVGSQPVAATAGRADFFNAAFFKLNALISVIFLVVTVVEVVFPGFRVVR